MKTHSAFLGLLVYICGVTSSIDAVAQPYKLNDSLIAGGDVYEAKVTPDGLYVVYRADKLVDGKPELFRVPIGGGTSVKLNIEITASQSGGVDRFEISPNGQYVVYAGNITQSAYTDLYSVPIMGGAAKRLNCDTADLFLVRSGPSIISDIQITPDSQRVLFLHDHFNFQQNRLYSAPIDKNAPPTLGPGVNQILCGTESTLELSPFDAPSRPVIDYKISPNSQRVVFSYGRRSVNQNPSDVDYDLYSSDIDSRDSSALVRLNTTNQQGVRQLFGISPNSNWVVYSAQSNDTDTYALYRARIASAETPIALSTPFNDVQYALRFAFTPNGQRVVYTAQSVDGGPFQVFSAPLSDAGSSVGLYPNALFGFGAQFSGFNNVDIRIGPDSQQVVYTRDHDTASVYELFTVNGTTSPHQPKRLVSLDSSNRNISRFELSDDGRNIVFTSDKLTDSITELFLVQSDGTGLKRISPALSQTQDVASFRLASDNGYVVYSIRESGMQQMLYATSLHNGSPFKLNIGAVSGSEIQGYALSPTGRHVVYWGDQNIDNTSELFAFELPKIDDELCVPVRTESGKLALVCL